MSFKEVNQNQSFTEGSIPKKMIGFMLPILGALILQAMYSAVDLLIVGRFGTTEGISGVATGSSIINMVTFTISALTTGVTVLIGKYIGEGCPHKIGGLIGNAVCFFAVLAVIISMILIVFARPITILMQAPSEAVSLTTLYIRICGAGFIFVVFYNFLSSIFRGLGDSRLPFLFVVIACIANIIGDLILVAGFKMNVAGAAIATIGAQAVSVILSLIIIRRKELPFRIVRKDFHFGKEIPHFCGIGAPLALQELLTNVSFLALCAFINRIGLDASSGYGVAQKIQSFIMLIPSSIMQSMASFVAQNVGAGREDRAKAAMKYGMGFGAVIGVAIAAGVFFYGDILSALFTDDLAVIARAHEFLRGFAPEAVVTSILFSFMGYFNGHSKALFVMLQGLAQSFLVRLPMSYMMSIRPNASLMEIGLAGPAATVFGIVLCLIYYVVLQKNLKSAAGSRNSEDV
ncbi:MAG: MATE family efflux transporter [Lachnoclostridium sp.]|nr:MATE family efflux transporter [Lachnospira sp.]MCM1248380.1 MATE family efflux transporter [Lachnoclostridium sp.]